MSRWSEAFTGASYQNAWKGAYQSVNDAALPDNPDANSLSEMTRLKKVVAFLEGVFDTLDPELIPENMINSVVGQAGTIKSNTDAYKGNKNLNYLKAANNAADNILTYIMPYTVATGKAARAAGRASRRYTDLVEGSIKKSDKLDNRQ